VSLEPRPAWPEPDSCSHIYDRVDREEHRYYRTPAGVFPGVTTVLKVLGLSREGLINWAVNLEREACLAAAVETFREAYSDRELGGVEWFEGAAEARLAGERAHQRALQRAADIGTQIHSRIRWFLARQVGQEAGECPVISEAAARGYISFTDWWGRAGLKPIRVEQPVWHAVLGYAGTIDLIAEDADGVVDVYDYKSGKGIYLEHHLQARAYVEAARIWTPVRSANLIRLPKSVDDSFDEARDIEELGDWQYGKRKQPFSEDELMAAFRAALIAWTILRRRPEFAP